MTTQMQQNSITIPKLSEWWMDSAEILSKETAGVPVGKEINLSLMILKKRAGPFQGGERRQSEHNQYHGK